MAFNLDAARKANKSDTEIANYLGSQFGFNVDAARKAGKTDTQIAEYLAANERPKEKSAQTQGLSSNDASDMNKVQKFAAGLGGGLYMLGKGVQQKAAQIGEAAGVVSPETVSKITSQGTAAREDLKRLTSQSSSAKVGEFVGEVGPTMALPGGVAGKAITRAGTAALSGLGIGAARFTGEGESTVQNAALGAVGGFGGSAAMSGAGKLVNAATGKFARTGTEKLGEKFGIRTTLGEDIGNTTLQKSETLLEKVPITGIRKFRVKQLEEADNAAKTFLGKYVADPANAGIESNRAFSSSLYNSMKESIEEVKDLPLYAIKTADKAREILDTYPSLFKQFQNVKREQVINDIVKDSGKGAMQPKTFDDMWTLRDGLGEMIGQAKAKLRSGDVDKTAISQLNALYKAVNNDIDHWAGTVGKPELRASINAANEAYKRYVVKYSLIQKAYDDAAGVSSAKEMFSPKTFSTTLKKLVAKDKAYGTFKPAEIEEMTGLANIMQVVKRAGQYAENPPTGNRVIDAAATGGFGAGVATMGIGATLEGAATVGATTSLMKFLVTTPQGKALIKAASKIEPSSPTMGKLIDKTYKLIARSGTGLALSDSDISILPSAEAADNSTVGRAKGLVGGRKAQIEEAMSEGEAGRQPMQQAAPASTSTSMSTGTANALLDKWIAEANARNEKKAAPKPKGEPLKITEKIVILPNDAGEEMVYVDQYGRVYKSDPNYGKEI